MTKRTSRQADIAKEAGVSQSTVSMVLNGTAENGRISAETRKRVLSTARRLQYVPASAQRPASPGTPTLLGVHTFEPIFPPAPATTTSSSCAASRTRPRPRAAT